MVTRRRLPGARRQGAGRCRLAALATPLLVGGMLTACGAGSPEREKAPVAAEARTIEIEGEALVFRPDDIEIASSEDVAIALSSTDIEHTLVIDEVGFFVGADGGQRQVSGLRIDEPGSYNAYCSIPGHRAAGMEMTVTVTK